VTTMTASAGVLVQPVARRFDTHRAKNHAGPIGLMVLGGGLVLSALTAQSQDAWLLVPCAIVLGCAYGLCLVAGLTEVQHMAGEGELAGMTAAYYALTYLGFAVPYLLAIGAHVAGYPVLFLMTAVLALATAATVARSSGSVGARDEQSDDMKAAVIGPLAATTRADGKYLSEGQGQQPVPSTPVAATGRYGGRWR
jgi:hypothetical protein